jgi:hypothetical protein
LAYKEYLSFNFKKYDSKYLKEKAASAIVNNKRKK